MGVFVFFGVEIRHQKLKDRILDEQISAATKKSLAKLHSCNLHDLIQRQIELEAINLGTTKPEFDHLAFGLERKNLHSAPSARRYAN